VVGKHLALRGAGPVLVVDDDPATRELLRRTVEAGGWPVEEAENGRVALERMAARRPAGCDDYDTKPIELPRLLGKIAALLAEG
jgi:CheY-like chemotaxis protein